MTTTRTVPERAARASGPPPVAIASNGIASNGIATASGHQVAAITRTAPATAAQLEAERLAALPADGYERLVRLAQGIAQVPVVALNFLGHTQQYVVAAIGLPVGARPLSDSFYWTLARINPDQALYQVPDLAADPRFARNSLTTGAPFARFYAGIPLHSGTGQVVGVLTFLDVVPRSLTEKQRSMLLDLSALLERELASQEEVLRAAEVQQRLLPTASPDLPGIEVAGRVVQAREAGGDFFDWQVIHVEDGMNQLQVVLADVMGKGLPAAMLASEVRAVVRGHSRYVDVGATVGRATMTTRHDLETNGLFVTLWIGRIDPTDGRIEYVDVGHGLTIIVSPRGVRRLKQDYLPLGISIEQYWRKAVDHLAYDEYLVAVSDGVYDTLGALGAPADLAAAFESLEQLLADRAGISCAEACDLIIEYARARQDSVVAADDCTALVVRRVPM